MHATDTRPAARLYFLDWVRILAFFLLIAYHVGMYYVSWDWHVKSPAASQALEPFMALSAPWRLALLFLVSGVASSFMLGRESVRRFIGQRSVRLLVPLVFGMLVIVPPQPYLEVVEKTGYAGSYLDFMRLYLTAYHGFCRDGSCLALPTWNHLWFVPYLWCYSLGLAALVALLGKRFDALAARTAALLTGWKIVVIPAAVLALVRILLASRYPETHALAGDWFNHATYFSVFMLAALLARVPQFWPRLAALRWPCLAIAAAGWCAVVIWRALPDDAIAAADVEAWRIVMRTLYATLAWCAICAACGFAQRHLNRDNAARRYLTEAVFPVYIAHQTLIVVLAHSLKPAHLAPGVEALVLIVLAATGSFATFELVRRVPLLRPLFGLARRKPQPALRELPVDAVAAGG